MWMEFGRLVQNDLSTAVIWSNSKPDVEFQYSGRFGLTQWHAIPEPPATLQGAVIWRNQCHDCATLECSVMELCNNSIRHIENRFSSYFILVF